MGDCCNPCCNPCCNNGGSLFGSGNIIWIIIVIIAIIWLFGSNGECC